MTLSKQMETVDQGILLRQISLLSLGGYALVILLIKRKRGFHINGSYGILMISFLLWATFSIIWADDIYVTSKRIASLLLISLGVLAISSSLSFKEIAEFTFFGCSLTLLLGLGCELLLGTFRPFASDYRFSGVFHANSQGQNCAVLFVVSFFLSYKLRHRASFFRLVGVIALLFLLLTKSRVAVLSGILAVIVGWVIISRHVSRKLLVALYLPLLMVFLGFVFFGEDFVRNLKAQSQNAIALGRQRETALWAYADRNTVWDESMQFVLKKPFTGYGYGSFWTPSHIASVTAAVGRGLIASAHSTYIDMLLSVGFLGTLIYISFILAGLKKSITLYKGTIKREYAIAAALIIWLLINSLFESLEIKTDIHIFVVFALFARLAFIAEGHRRPGYGSRQVDDSRPKRKALRQGYNLPITYSNL